MPHPCRAREADFLELPRGDHAAPLRRLEQRLRGVNSRLDRLEQSFRAVDDQLERGFDGADERLVHIEQRLDFLSGQLATLLQAMRPNRKMRLPQPARVNPARL